MMDHALTNQDLGSDEASSSEAPLDDTELQRRLVETFEKELAPGGARSLRFVWVPGPGGWGCAPLRGAVAVGHAPSRGPLMSLYINFSSRFCSFTAPVSLFTN